MPATGTKHEGVSCDSCMKSNFRGRRYKCLMCYDYDLCGSCRDIKAITGRHSENHPMQCILTRTDLEIYYGGETILFDQGQSFTCPYCGEMGFSDMDLADHVGVKHPNSINDVICPICSTMQGGDPNHVTEDLLAHLSTDHQPNSNETSSGRSLGAGRGGRGYRGLPSSGPTMVRRRGQTRPGGPAAGTGASHASASEATLSRAAAIQRSVAASRGGDLSPSELSAVQHLLPPTSALSASIRDGTDPISGFAELLSQLTNVGRASGQPSLASLGAAAAAGGGQPPPSQTSATSAAGAMMADTASSLHQLQLQLQLERQTLLFGRLSESSRLASTGSTRGAESSQLDPRLAAAYMSGLSPFSSGSRQAAQAAAQNVTAPPQTVVKAKKEKEGCSLLEKLLEERTAEDQKENSTDEHANRALFIEELLIGTLSEDFATADDGGGRNGHLFHRQDRSLILDLCTKAVGLLD
ncbi:E3 ubiquitin-protein ligase KCMF1 [Hypsibius exemplaris]|uniref:RING-type E3 ubiquitin transferase n=1 Tax=Hypsibius exemplaris TaxID=2072580 RepID=A0A1W0XCK7_HYPEX|nr:E3 ubiquitin-protein ligase KCMF1 [Hypsibius exemplaris]